MNPRSSPRDHALRALDQRRLPGWAAGSLKKLRPAAPPSDPRDLALAENIVAGVTKNLLLLQHLIAHFSGRNLKSIDAAVQKILAVALYQIRFLTRVPNSAAVDQAVDQSKRLGQSKASGFVNAVLRKATSSEPAALPPREQPADHARLALSHPAELFNRLAKLFGERKALLICEHNQSEPPTIVRLGPGVDVKSLYAEGLKLTPHQQRGMTVVEGAKRGTLADWADRGLAQVQDPTAAAVAALCQLEPSQSVLDRCSGLGTKTLQLRDAVGDSGNVVAMDPNEERCAGLKQLLARRKITNVEVRCAAWLDNEVGAASAAVAGGNIPAAKAAPTLDPPALFDRVLADVPCSNSGVLSRRPEARYHQSPESLRALAKLQDAILADTAPFVRPGGLLVYSTCSLWPEENRHRVDAFLKRHPDFTLLLDRDTLPSLVTDPTAPPRPDYYHDGGYVAVLGKSG